MWEGGAQWLHVSGLLAFILCGRGSVLFVQWGRGSAYNNAKNSGRTFEKLHDIRNTPTPTFWPTYSAIWVGNLAYYGTS